MFGLASIALTSACGGKAVEEPGDLTCCDAYGAPPSDDAGEDAEPDSFLMGAAYGLFASDGGEGFDTGVFAEAEADGETSDAAQDALADGEPTDATVVDEGVHIVPPYGIPPHP
jgi:hypothetical protein